MKSTDKKVQNENIHQEINEEQMKNWLLLTNNELILLTMFKL